MAFEQAHARLFPVEVKGHNEGLGSPSFGEALRLELEKLKRESDGMAPPREMELPRHEEAVPVLPLTEADLRWMKKVGIQS
jgi:hypothetical protein